MDAARQGWQLRAAYDESFLDIRIESSTRFFLAPGSHGLEEAARMAGLYRKAGVSGVGEFVLHANANIGDQVTFDE